MTVGSWKNILKGIDITSFKTNMQIERNFGYQHFQHNSKSHFEGH